jgi:DNA-binding CsgD family transcriptional regulator
MQTLPPVASTSPDQPAAGAGSRLLDELEFPFILLDKQGLVLYVNDSARREVLSSTRLLEVGNDRLVFHTARDADQVRHALAAAAKGSRLLLILGKSEDKLTAAFVPFDRGDEEGQVLMIFGNRQTYDPLSLKCYARQHALTPSETNVLSALLQSQRPSEIAANNGVSISTVRSQIGSIRTKTGAPSIRELISRVASLPPLMPQSLHPALVGEDSSDSQVGKAQVGEPAIKSQQISEADRQRIRDFYRRA